MNLMDLLENEGGSGSVARLAGQLGIDQTQARELVRSLSPVLADGLRRRAVITGGDAELEREIESGKYQRYLDEPERLADERAREEGNDVLGRLFGSADESREVAVRASENTGFDQSLIEYALPIVASLAMGALGRRSRVEGGMEGGLGSLAGLLYGGAGRPEPEQGRSIGGKLSYPG